MIPYDIEVQRKTGYRVVNPSIPVIIYDERGIPFYDTSRLERPVYAFNLPAGKFTVMSGRIAEKSEPEKFDMYELPKPNRRMKDDPQLFKVEVGDCPFSCAINWKNKTITYDESLCDKPLPELIYIYWHECGHRFYGMPYKPKPWSDAYREKYIYYEACCDRYAANKMIEAGYNPSQIGEAIVGSLKNNERKEILIDTLVNENHFDFDRSEEFCDCDALDYTTTPTTDWSCADWVLWHKDLLKAYSDGRLGKLSAEKALDETNRVFAYHWNESAGFSKKFWGSCGWTEGFFNYFRDIGYTDHISFLAGIGMPLLTGATNIAQGAGDVTSGAGSLISGIGKNIFLYLLMAIIILYLLKK